MPADKLTSHGTNMQTGNPRGVPPWRKRDAEPGLLAIVIVLSLAVFLVVLLILT